MRLRTIAARGITASLIGQILIEESVLGWEELELEVVRDAENNKITYASLRMWTQWEFTRVTVSARLHAYDFNRTPGETAGILPPNSRSHWSNWRHQYSVRP